MKFTLIHCIGNLYNNLYNKNEKLRRVFLISDNGWINQKCTGKYHVINFADVRVWSAIKVR